jgi:hypothetical protein
MTKNEATTVKAAQAGPHGDIENGGKDDPAGRDEQAVTKVAGLRGD